MNGSVAGMPKRSVLVGVCTLLAVMSLSAAAQTTRYVWQNSPSPGYPYTSWNTAAHEIQTAVNASVAGETILVNNDTAYILSSPILVNICITIRGVGDDKPIVSGDGSVQCFNLNNGCSVLDNLRICWGSADNKGAGVTIGANGGTVQNCQIDNNSAMMKGGGVYIVGAGNGTVRNCRIFANHAESGGGVYCDAGGTVTNCDISSNHGRDLGGGVFVETQGTVANCVITNNVCSTGAGLYSGGGIALSGFGAAVNCVIRDNYAEVSGGGVYLAGGGQVIKCQIENNSCGDAGGGVLFSSAGIVYGSTIRNNRTENSGSQGGGVHIYTDGWIESCLVADNVTMDRGGGVYMDGGGTVKNCSVQDNTATYWGGGIDCDQGGTVLGCTIAGNTSDQAGGIHIWPGVTVQDSIIYDNNGLSENPNYYRDGGGGDLSYCCLSPLLTGGNNIDVDPCFVNTAAGNYRLLWNSPCINTATPGDPDSGEQDADLRARMAGAYQDMGAYEWTDANVWSGAADLGGGWKWLAWFGFFHDAGNGWIYHNEHHWMYTFGTTPDSIWFWTQDLGWLWIRSTIYPCLYRNTGSAWLWYQIGSSGPRWFNNLTTGQWESH